MYSKAGLLTQNFITAETAEKTPACLNFVFYFLVILSSLMICCFSKCFIFLSVFPINRKFFELSDFIYKSCCQIFIILLLFRPTCGGRNYILKWVFLFSHFWPIDLFIVEKCEWYHLKAVPV